MTVRYALLNESQQVHRPVDLLGQNCTNRWSHKGWVVYEDTLLGVPVGAEQELEKRWTLCQAGRGLCEDTNARAELKVLQAKCG